MKEGEITATEFVSYTTDYIEKELIFLTFGIKSFLKFDNGIRTEDIDFLNIIDKNDLPNINSFLEKIEKGEPAFVEFKLNNVNGKDMFLRHFTFPNCEYGKPATLINYVYDITEEKKNQVELKRSEERFRKLFETAEDLIFSLDEKGPFVFVHSTGALAFEFLSDELIGKHFIDFVTEDDKSIVAKAFQELLKTDKIITFESSFITKFNKTIVFEINARSTFDNEKFEGLVGIARTITTRRAEQEKTKDLHNKLIEANRLISVERDRAKQKISVLEELNRLKNEFVSNISHEFRTPLASIIGFSETLDQDPEIPDSMRIEFNRIILNEAKRLADLINDVLEISKIENKEISLNKIPFDIVELLKLTIENHKEKANAKSITIFYDLPDEEVILNADKEKIEQVLDNLLNNALKFTNKDGRITILAQNFYKEFEVIISDTGIGIPKNDLPYIFQKFYRVSRPGFEIPGTGLGLAIVKQIIDLHKGFITVQSEENKGTTIVIKLSR